MLIDLVKFSDLAIGDKFKSLPLQPTQILALGFLLEGEVEVEEKKTFEEQIAEFKANLKQLKIKKKEVYKETNHIYQKVGESKYIGSATYEGKPIEYDKLYPKHYYVIKL
jgi:hypothetical protein